MDKPKPRWGKLLREKYRVNVLNPENFQELSSFTFNWLQVIMVVSSIAVVSFTICLLLIIFTPLNGYVVKANDERIDKEVVQKAFYTIDSLERWANVNQQFATIYSSIIKGNDTFSKVDDLKKGVSIQPKASDLFYVSETDSTLRYDLESKKFENLEGKEINSSIHFYPPVNGVVNDSFNASKSHLAIDIVAAKDEAVKAVQDGVVLFSDFTSSTGYVIMLQHDNNFISVYKHNSVLLKNVGSFVEAGETIGIIGNSGEQTTGRHLHFELWQNGKALNPLDYIKF